MADALKPLVANWLAKINKANECKRQEFQNDADECMRFLDGPYDFLYRPRGASARGFDVDDLETRAPSVRLTINKAAELVQLFGPAIYHRNPVRKVNPRKIIPPPESMFGDVQNDPYAQQIQQAVMTSLGQSAQEDVTRAEILERYLNYTPNALDLKNQSRWAMTEALIKGAGVMWTRPHRPPGSPKQWVGTFWDSIDNLQIDPDAQTISDAKWVARKCTRPIWEVERMYGYQPGTLKPQKGMETPGTTASYSVDEDGAYKRSQGLTSDAICYWEIYSKMGMGGRLQGLPEHFKVKFDAIGDYVYLVIAEGIDYPINLPPPLCDLFKGDDADAIMALAQGLPEIKKRCEWETPYWVDNQWPFTLFAFHWKPGQLWPMSHLKPGLGELMFLNWAWSFLAAKVRIASRDFIAIAKAAGEELKEKIKHGSDFTVIEMDNVLGSIDQVVKFLQHPGFNPEIYRVIEAITMQFDKRVGLTELMYGQSARQMRSAQEAQLKSDAINVRPDDMANQAEDAMTDIARKEAFCARWHLNSQDVQHVLGPIGAQLWDKTLVMTDPSAVIYQLEYRVEANSARKPNKAKESEDMGQAMQNLFPNLFAYAQATGDVKPANALISDWGNSVDKDTTDYQMQPPPPPPPMPPEGTPPEGGPPQK